MVRLLIPLLCILLMACDGWSNALAQGYIEGRYTYLATSVSGALKQLLVARGTQVKQGQKLYELDAQPESDAYQAAVENLKQAVNARDAIAANLTYAKLTYDRYKILVPKKAIQQSQLDNAKSIYDATLAQLAQANATIASSTATLAEAKWRLDQKIAIAPVDAIVFDTYYRLGEYTVANQPVLSLLAPADIKAIFYVPEASLSGIQLGDKISVQCDGCKDRYEGRVSFISPSAEYTPPVIFSEQTNTKLIYRIEAAFEPSVAVRLHPGQPVMVSYRAKSR